MNRLVLFILLLLFWVFLTWPTELGPAYLQDLGTGACGGIAGDLDDGRINVEGSASWLQPQRYVWAVVYLFVLAAYVIKANFEVAYRVLHPAMPIRPGIVKIKTRLQRPVIAHRIMQFDHADSRHTGRGYSRRWDDDGALDLCPQH